MARIRSIKPEFWDDRKLAKRTSRDARLLYIGLWNLADEHARLNGDPQWIKGQIFSYEDDVDADVVAKLLEELAAPELCRIVQYEADGDPYIFLPNLARHQRLEPEKVRSRLPAPPSESRANSSERGADETVPGADSPGSDADLPALLYGAGGMEHVAGSRGSRENATLPSDVLLNTYLAKTSPRPTRDEIEKLGKMIDRHLGEKTAVDVIAEALERYRPKSNYGPNLLPKLIKDVLTERANGGARASPRGKHKAWTNPEDDSGYDKDL